MRELVIATTNQGKLREIRELLSDLDLKITSLADYPGHPPIVEDGRTFAENALIKARIIAQYTNKPTLGEDSGLEVDALGNRPGIYSARFSGEGATDKKNNLKLLRLLRAVPYEQRQARYRCWIALVVGTEVLEVVGGSCGGVISFYSKGKNGFGYDPLFYIPRHEKTFGQLDPAIKARISHRARAFKRLRIVLEKYTASPWKGE